MNEARPPEPLDELYLQELVTRGYESRDLDYKAAGGWERWDDKEKAEFVRDVAAMGNSDGPGWIIIGVAEDSAGAFICTGVTEEQASGFDPTPVGEWAQKYIQPPVQIRVLKPRIEGKLYIVVQVQPFQSVPHICVETKANLHKAAIYIRTEACQSQKIADANQMRALLDRATVNSADALVARIDEIYRRANPVARSLPDADADGRSQFQSQIDEIRRKPGGAS